MVVIDHTPVIGWIDQLGMGDVSVDGLVRVEGYDPSNRPAVEVIMMEKAAEYGAYATFFEASEATQTGSAQAFVFISDGPANDLEFAALHRRLWSWGGVPLLYRRTPGLIQLFRCAHRPDFFSPTGALVCKPVKSLRIAADISGDDVWWNAERIRNGTLWDDPAACKLLLSATKSAHRHLIEAVKHLHATLKDSKLLSAELRRRLLILSLLIAYLDERSALPAGFFAGFKSGATTFAEVLADGESLVALLDKLEERFNGNIFLISDAERSALKESTELEEFSRLVKAHDEVNGQLSLWALYSFRDLPVEVISHIYQLFVKDADSSVYTPPALVRLMLDEALSWPRLDHLILHNQAILDPSCGSGVFLVEAYKRLVLHWRSRNDWAKPSIEVLKCLLDRLHGIDLEPGAVELAAFSLCLALCDALKPEDIRASVGLFPKLEGRTLLKSCFFEAKDAGLIEGPIGVVVGNPPFESALKTKGAKDSYDRYVKKYGTLPDKQVAYLFLHESMELVAPGGVLSMLQQYNFLYNIGAAPVRQTFIERWDVREILDFISIRGLFTADTKIVAIVAEANTPPSNRKILHAVFRRGGRAEAEQRFDIDYYDLYWMQRASLLRDNGPERWRSNLLGGARTYSFVKRLMKERTLKQYAQEKKWSVGEGFAEGKQGVSRSANHLIGKPLLPSEALTVSGVDENYITTVLEKPIEGPRSAKLFTPPMLLIREHEDLPHALWEKSYLTYKNKIVGLAAKDVGELRVISEWLSSQTTALRAYVAGVSVRMLTQKATTLACADILALPFPESGTLDMSDNEMIVAYDMVHYFRDYVRLGNASELASQDGEASLEDFVAVFCTQINAVYRNLPLRPLLAQRWPGILCQPFVFGNGEVDWADQDELRGKLNSLLREQRNSVLTMTRVARVYDQNFIFLLKPNRLRYWLRSTALRDSDDTLADLRSQGF